MKSPRITRASLRPQLGQRVNRLSSVQDRPGVKASVPPWPCSVAAAEAKVMDRHWDSMGNMLPQETALDKQLDG